MARPPVTGKGQSFFLVHGAMLGFSFYGRPAALLIFDTNKNPCDPAIDLMVAYSQSGQIIYLWRQSELRESAVSFQWLIDNQPANPIFIGNKFTLADLHHYYSPDPPFCRLLHGKGLENLCASTSQGT